MKFGLEEKTYKDIKKVLLQFPYTFYIFGSRAKGNYKNTSDIDLAIFEKIDNIEQFKIKDELDKLNIIYMIDIVFVNENTKKELVNYIKKEGVKF